MRTCILWALPYPAQVLAGFFVWRSVKAAVDGQGTGRYSVDEVRTFRRELWNSLEVMVVEAEKRRSGDQPFWILGGDQPTEADTSLFGQIAAHLAGPAYVKSVSSTLHIS